MIYDENTHGKLYDITADALIIHDINSICFTSENFVFQSDIFKSFSISKMQIIFNSPDFDSHEFTNIICRYSPSDIYLIFDSHFYVSKSSIKFITGITFFLSLKGLQA